MNLKCGKYGEGLTEVVEVLCNEEHIHDNQ